MRFFSILLAGAFLMVAGCSGADTDSDSGGAPGPTGPGAGMDPAAMPNDPLKDDEGNEVESGAEEPPAGSKITPDPAPGTVQDGGDKKETPKEGGDKKD